ncbi:DUF2637 domain-containing protein [Streptomyces sp. WAC05858]|uniref:DUF2637 domain-containing protein n=1 Tax=Streptomyces TaxID=1883 RepID=UPI0021B04C4D|nr:DUF2637 domain-containing protein [Streptomyces sp. WAC05858]
MNPRNSLAAGAALVTVALTAAAFWLSYEHLHDVAAGNGLKDPARAWAWPATVDLFIIAGELLMLRAALAKTVDPWAIVLTVAGSGGSIALNVAGVGVDARPLEYVVAAVPPVAALLAFGALMRQVHQALSRLAAPVEETTPEPNSHDIVTGSPAVPEAVPAEVRPERQQYQLDSFAERLVPVESPSVVAAEYLRTRAEVHAEYVPEEPEADVPQDAIGAEPEDGGPDPEDEVLDDSPPPPGEDTLTAQARIDFRDAFDKGAVPTYRALKSRYRINQDRAGRIRDEFLKVAA